MKIASETIKQAMKTERAMKVKDKIIHFTLVIAFAAAGCAVGHGMDENEEYAEGEAYDENPYAPYMLGKADSVQYEVPDLPDLVRPEIIVSLDGLNILLMDRATGFRRVYPTGVGRLNSNGASITPMGHYATGPDIRDSWWYMAARYAPSYFHGLPFLRLTILNSRGLPTYGFHGPTTPTLIRDYVSAGCMRMARNDIIELFWAVRNHASTPVTIQKEWIYDAAGQRVDLDTDVVLWEADEAIPFGASVGPRSDEPFVNETAPFVGTPCIEDSDCNFTATGGRGWCYVHGSDPAALEGFCTVSCEGYCPDSPGYATTFCVDLEGEGEGACVSRSEATNFWCDDMPETESRLASRFIGSSSAVQAEQVVCWPLD